MKRLQTNLALKTIAALLAVISIAVSLCGGLYLIYYSDALFGYPYEESSQYYNTIWSYRSDAATLLELRADSQLYGSNYAQQLDIEALEERLAPENTNFRYVARDNATGDIVADNTGGLPLEEYPGLRPEANITSLCQLYRRDAVTHDSQDGLYVEQGDEAAPVSLPEGVIPSEVVLECSVLKVLTARDDFWQEAEDYAVGEPVMLPVTLAAMVLSLVLVIFLGYTAGHKKGVEGVHLNWHDRIPYDLYLFLQFWLILGCGSAFAKGWSNYRYYGEDPLLALVAVAALAGGIFCLATLLTTVTRCKAGTLLRNTILWRLCAWLGRCAGGWVRSFCAVMPMAWRFVLAFLIYLGVNAVLARGLFYSWNSGLYLLGLIILNGAVGLLGCRWIAQWRRIRAGAAAIVGGDPTAQIDTQRMYPDLREHAQALNNLGEAINAAVEQRMKSEHFKAELITNVSHDLKTPLTSIINYVDLLKKTDIQDPTALEYIEVLDRKSQRLKKLTEDLVEASKASTGNVAVEPARMDLVEFTQQAVAEYQERLAAQRLTLVAKMPETPAYILADGRHMWRILDNLLGNCVKYAMEGTRVYLEVVEWDGKASISLKNISREPLTGDAEALTERFVRGDESRTTEGSGLGLSIARSLTEVQGGVFRIATDGDLFKATVYFPVAEQ